VHYTFFLVNDSALEQGPLWWDNAVVISDSTDGRVIM
jgi:hypothetical protein